MYIIRSWKTSVFFFGGKGKQRDSTWRSKLTVLCVNSRMGSHAEEVSVQTCRFVYRKWMVRMEWLCASSCFSITITWFDCCASWFGALGSNCDDSGLCLVDDEAVESTKWTEAVLIFSVGFVVVVVECAAQHSSTFLLELTFEYGDFFCLPNNCVCSVRSCSPMDDINDDDGDDGNDGADDDDCVFV